MGKDKAAERRRINERYNPIISSLETEKTGLETKKAAYELKKKQLDERVEQFAENLTTFSERYSEEETNISDYDTMKGNFMDDVKSSSEQIIVIMMGLCNSAALLREEGGAISNKIQKKINDLESDITSVSGSLLLNETYKALALARL